MYVRLVIVNLPTLVVVLLLSSTKKQRKVNIHMVDHQKAVECIGMDIFIAEYTPHWELAVEAMVLVTLSLPHSLHAACPVVSW